MRDASAYQTDKIATGLLREYERVLTPVADLPLSVLELGVLAGGSLLWMDDFLTHPRARITGVDIDLTSGQRIGAAIPVGLFSPRVRLVEGNQADRGLLGDLIESRGPFDLVIDDASHEPTPTRAAFDVLWPAVMPVGVYVIEDWALELRGDGSYPESVGMAALVFGLVRESQRLGIARARLYCQGPRCTSLAVFTKGGGIADGVHEV